MTFQTNTIALADLITTLISLVVVFFSVYRRNNTGAMRLAGLMGAVAFWAAGGMLEAAATQAADKIFWSQISYFGIVTTPVMWLIFAAQYARRDHWFRGWIRWALWVFPIATVVVALTNPWHHLLWGEITASQYPNVLIYPHHIWFWLHVGYSYLLLLAGTALLILGLRHLGDGRRTPATLILLGAFIPWIGNLIYAVGLSPIPGLDITPITLMASGCLIAAAILRFGLLDLVPLARDAVVENMLDGIIVIDEQDRVVDINPAARSLFPEAAADCIGRPVQSFFLVWSNLSERLKGSSESHAEIQLGGATLRTLDVRASAFKTEKGHVAGRLVALRDITPRIQMQNALLAVQSQLNDQEGRYRAIVENAPFPIIISSQASGDVLYVNQRTEDVLGIPAHSGRRTKSAEFYARAEDRERVLAAVAQSTSAVVEHMVDLRRADGRILRCLLSIGQLTFDGQKAFCISFMERDKLPGD